MCSIGPRQTTAAFSSTKKPIDITLTPLGESSGRILRSPLTSGLRVDAEHARDRVAVDVAVEGAGRVAFGGQRRGQVGGHRRLADAALAGGDADHVLDLGQRALRQLAAAERLLQVAFLLVGEDVEADRDRGHAVQLGDLLGDRLFEVGADRAAGGGQRDDDLDPAALLDLDRADHAQLDDRAAQLGVDDGAQLLGDLVLASEVPSRPFSQRRARGSADPPQGGEISPPSPWPSVRKRAKEGGCRAREVGWDGSSRWGSALALALLLLVGAARRGRASTRSPSAAGTSAPTPSWADTTGGAKFRPDACCVPPAGADPFDGAHLKSFTRDGQATVSGTRFARWRWEAPAGTGITQVRGTWWHALHDGIEQRIGVGNWGGGFDAFAAAGGTDVTPREFVAGFTPPSRRSRTACSAPGPKASGARLEPGSWSAMRALTITVEDDQRAGGRDRRRPRRRRLAPRQRRASASGAATPAAASASAKPASTAPAST